MTRRFDLTGSGSPAVTPNHFGSLWDHSAGAVVRPLPAARTTSTQTGNGVAETSATNAWDVATHQWVSDETFASAGSCDPGNFDTLLLCLESSSSMNAYMQVVIRVISGDGTTERGVLYAGQTATTSSSTATDPNAEFDTTFSRVRRLTGTTTPVTVQVGDRLALEYGYRACNTSTSSFTGTLTPGSTSGTDLTTAQVNGTSTNRPWIEFTNDPFTVTAGTVTGTLAGSLQAKTAAFTVFAQGSMTLAGDLQRKTGAFTTWAQAHGTLAGDLQRKTATFTLEGHPVATLAGDLQRKTATFQAAVDDPSADLTLSGTLQPKTAAFTIDAAAMVALAGDLQPKTATFDLSLASSATLAGSLQAKTAAFEISTAERPVRIQATLRRKTASITLKIPPYILIAGTLRAKTASFLIVKPPQGDFTNMVGGLTLNGYGVHTWQPAVAAPPVGLAHDYEVAIAHSNLTVTNGRPEYDLTSQMVKRHRDRILVGGKDITNYRGVQTPTPSYALIEPLLYGAGRLVLPQVDALHETPGSGALKWCAIDKTVVVQRVDVDTEEVVGEDYRGFVDDYDNDGDALVLVLGGAVSGRMALRWHPKPVFKVTTDGGRLVADHVRQSLPGTFSPLLGPTTGIRLHTWGGMNRLDWFNELIAKLVKKNGDQFTVSKREAALNPDSGVLGTWGCWLKDRETIHATIYFDDARMFPSLHEGDRNNRVFATGVTKEGQRVDFNVYPGLVQGEAPEYPMADNSTLTEGATDGDTDTGDGVTVMIHRLIQMGFLTRDDGADFVWDDEVTDALERLQEEAGIAETGNLNPTTWRKLYDLDATGYSLAGATTLPAAQTSKTRMWNREASGALSERNPNFDPLVNPRDVNYDMGPGMDGAQQIRKYAKTELSAPGDWAGTVSCHLALIRGEHNPGEAFTEADVMSAREIRPGMNVWAPYWRGGTLFHVSGVNVPDGGRAPELVLDTRARDTMKAWEVVQRNRDSRRNPARLWANQYRSSTTQKDGLATWDRLGGRIDKTPLKGGRWTVFPVVAGQAGTVQRIRIKTNDVQTRYCVAVFGKQVSEARLNHIQPAPLSEAGTAKWDKQWVQDWWESRFGLYRAGGFEQRCGYWPGQETNDNGDPTGNPITGKYDDAAGFSYFVKYVLWVAVWAEEDCYIPAGRIMWNQRESGD